MPLSCMFFIIVLIWHFSYKSPQVFAATSSIDLYQTRIIIQMDKTGVSGSPDMCVLLNLVH